MSGAGGGFSAETDRLGAHAAEFETLAERAGRIAADLTHTLDVLPRPWGDDAVGRSFAAVHDEPSARTRDVLESLGPSLARVGERFADAAAAYRTADADAAENIIDAEPAG